MRWLAFLAIVFSSAAHAQSVEETAFFLASGFDSAEHSTGIAKRSTSNGRNASAEQLTMNGPCKFTFQRLNSYDGKVSAGRISEFDFSKLSGIDFSTAAGIQGAVNITVILQGEPGLYCTTPLYRETPDPKNRQCGPMGVVELSLPQPQAPAFGVRYQQALAYYRQQFCKGRAF
ncbi:hypothetical protein ABIF74_011808 [Bradyrhizobium japonicum]